MAYFRRRRGYRLGLRRRRFGGMLRRRYGFKRRRFGVPKYGMRSRRTTSAMRTWPPMRVQKVDTAVQDASIDVAGAVVNLFTDTGNKNLVRYLNWRCVLNGGTAANDPPLIRVILFVDKRGLEGTPPTVSGLNDGVLENPTVQSSLNITPAASGRFVILSDRTFTFNQGANVASATGTGAPLVVTRFYKVFKRLNMKQFKFNSDVATVSYGPALYCLYLSSQDEIGSIDGAARVGFTNLDPLTGG